MDATDEAIAQSIAEHVFAQDAELAEFERVQGALKREPVNPPEARRAMQKVVEKVGRAR